MMKFFAASVCLCTAMQLRAQVSDPLPNPAARLEQLDSTYSSTLRKYHAPVILDYLRDLEKLHQSLVALGRADAATQVQAEIEKTRKLSGSTGLLSYDSLKPAPESEKPAAEEDGPPPPGKGARRFSPDAITLSSSNAVNASPASETMKPRPDGKALPLGHAEWKVERVPAGVYDVMLVSSSIDGAERMTVKATLGTYSAEHRAPPPPPDSSPNDFRVFRVGTFELADDVNNAVLILESSDPTRPCLWVRNVILTHPKPPVGGKPPPDGKGPPGGRGGPPGGGPGGPPPRDGRPPPDGNPPPGSN